MKKVKIALKVLRILIPLVLLSIIFHKVDLDSILSAFKTVNIKYLAISLVFSNIIQVIGGAARWYLLVNKQNQTQGIIDFIRIYWVAMFYGYFVPSNIGMDIYRVISVAKQKENYEEHIAVLLGEKLYSVLFSILILCISYFIVYQSINQKEILQGLNLFFILFLSVLFISIILIFSFKRLMTKFIIYFSKAIKRYFKSALNKFSSKLPLSLNRFLNQISFLIKKRFIIKNIFFTLILKLSLAIGGYFLFLSLGIELNFWHLLFANSVFFILFLLPISFGSLGIREGSYIIVYGLFGVTAETALAASFLALGRLLFTISLGGLISLTDNVYKMRIKNGS